MMKALTKTDIKELHYQCRMGYVLPIFIFLLTSIFSVIIFGHLILISGCAIIAVLLSYGMNRKYYADIRNNEKIAKPKIIQRKISKTDHEAGSANVTTLPHNRKMKEFIRYDFIIDNTKFEVDKDLFESCRDGDEVILYYAPKSKYLISIEKE